MPELKTIDLSNVKYQPFFDVSNALNKSYIESNAASRLLSYHLQNVLPQDVNNALHEMGKSGKPDVLLLKNLPVDNNILHIESLQNRLEVKSNISESLIFAISSIMGCHLYSHPKEQGGNLIHNVTPVKGYEHLTSSKSLNPFPLHVEGPFDKNSPDFLILVCLEEDKTVETTYFFIEDIINKIPENHIETMKKPLFEIRSGAGLAEEEKGIFSLIEENQGKLKFRLYQSMEQIKALNNEAQDTLNFISEIFSKIMASESEKVQSISLKLGEALILNNGWGLKKLSGIMHGRKGFVTNPFRWLQRGSLKLNLPLNEKQENESLYRTITSLIINAASLKLDINLLLGCAQYPRLAIKEAQTYLSTENNPEHSSEYLASSQSTSKIILHGIWSKKNLTQARYGVNDNDPFKRVATRL